MFKLKKMWKYALRKAGEPSSWAGICVSGPIVAPHIPSGWWTVILNLGPMLAGGLLIWMDENADVASNIEVGKG